MLGQCTKWTYLTCLGLQSIPKSAVKANLVAITYSPLRPLMARPTSSSLVKGLHSAYASAFQQGFRSVDKVTRQKAAGPALHSRVPVCKWQHCCQATMKCGCLPQKRAPIYVTCHSRPFR